jgi:enoyl-CoA hydratase
MSETASPHADGMTATPPKVIIARNGAVMRITLNRPEALNAFDDDMRRSIAAEIPKIARNPDIYVVVLGSSSAKAFCAGGDVRALIKAARQDTSVAAQYFAGEYSLDWLLECFSKPTVSLIDGLCMGSGAGLTLYNTHRVAGENYKFAMPETAIGLFPDVGVAHVLARMPWPIGNYLGLTGRTIGRADAYWLGLATHCIATEKFHDIVEQLADAQTIDPLLDDLHEPQEIGPVEAEKSRIEDLFGADTLGGILEALQRAAEKGDQFASGTLADLRKRSPISLAITDRHIRSAQTLDLRDTLKQDYRLAIRCLGNRDFAEGVRAALIDKDHAPKWQHLRVEDITEAEIDTYFASLGEDELDLPTRAEMQSARV